VMASATSLGSSRCMLMVIDVVLDLALSWGRCPCSRGQGSGGSRQACRAAAAVPSGPQLLLGVLQRLPA